MSALDDADRRARHRDERLGAARAARGARATPARCELLRTAVALATASATGAAAATASSAAAGARRRAAGLLLRAGRSASPAARSAPPTPTRSCACCELAGRAARAGRRLRRVGRRAHAGGRWRRSPATGAIFREHVALSGRVPQISIVIAALGAGGGSYSPGAHRLRGHDARREHVPHRPRRRRARSMGEDVDADALGGAARPRAQRRLPPGRRRRRRRRRSWPATCSAYLPQRSGEPADRAARARRCRRRPRRCRARRARARSTTCATSLARIVDGGALLEVAPRWARNIVCAFARIDGRAGRRRRQPAAPPRRRARRRRGAEGGALRAHAATCSACRWSCSSTRRASCRARKQEPAGRDPPRRQARARVRRRRACRG